MNRKYIISLITIFFPVFVFANTLDEYIKKSQWDDVVQNAYEITKKNPKNYDAKLKGAYGLFQKGYYNAALTYLKDIPLSEWNKLPQGKDRLVEIVLLFQKKLPAQFVPWRLDQISQEISNGNNADELNYAKGRYAFEIEDYKNAEKYFLNVKQNSRYFVASLYLLGAINVKWGRLTEAAAMFSKIFEPAVYEQASEFWKDISSEVTSYWGVNLKIQLTTDPLLQIKKIGELSQLALARLAYAEKKFELAIQRYNKIPATSPYFSKSQIEKIWCLLSLSQHSQAEEAANKVSMQVSAYQNLELKILKALIMTDAGQSENARKELDYFQSAFDASKKDIEPFLDSQTDIRIQSIVESSANILNEINNLKKEDLVLFGAYKKFIADLENLQLQSHSLQAKWIKEHILSRRADLEKLFIQSKLIRAETYLEDREKLKNEFKRLGETLLPEQQIKYEKKLVDLLKSASENVQDLNQTPNLRFRQSEILWELGTTLLILNEEKEGEKFRLKAIKMIEALTKEKFNKNDQALFFLGFAYMETGRESESIKVFLDYVKKYPRHVHVPDAFRILGDKSFDNNNFRLAEEYYKNVLSFPDSPFVGYALYKLGWSGYNLRSYGRALLGLEEAYQWTKKSPHAGQLLSLQREARRDLISVYAELGDHKKAFKYFKSIDENELPWVMDLIKQLENNGQYEKTQDLYAQLLQVNPKSEENMLYMSGIIQSAYKLQRWPTVLETVNDLLKLYSEKLKMPAADGSKTFQVESIIREAVSAHINDFKQTASDEIKKRIINLNELYLKAFEKWEQSQPVVYRHAQFLNENLKLNDAARYFEAHWLNYSKILREPLKEEALRNLISVLGKLEDENKNTDLKLSTFAEKIIFFSTEYEKMYPHTKYARSILFLKSSILLKFHKYEESIGIGQKLLDDKADDDITKKAFKNLAKAYYAIKDWQRTYNWALKTKGPSAELQTIKEEAYFLWAQSLSDPQKAADLYLKISQDSQVAKLHDKSLYNAYIYLEKINDYSQALDVAEKLEKKNPQFESLIDIAGSRASLYQESGQYQKAFDMLNMFLKKKSNPELTAQALLNRALILEGLGQEAEAVNEFKKYVSLKEGTTLAGTKSAEAAIKRIKDTHLNTPIVTSKEFGRLLQQKVSFEKEVNKKAQDFITQIKENGMRLQKVSQAFLKFSEGHQNPVYDRYESICAVPFLYSHYAESIKNLKGKEQDLNIELDKIAQPIEAKALEFAQSCMSQSQIALHKGPQFEAVLKTWGWQKDAALVKKVNSLLSIFEKHYPLISKNKNNNETELIKQLVKQSEQKKPHEDTWYDLSALRYNQKKYNLSRLTVVDALNRFPQSEKLINLLAAIDAKKNKSDIISYFDLAASKGSMHGYANKGFLLLKEYNYDQAKIDLQKAYDAGVLSEFAELKNAVREVLK